MRNVGLPKSGPVVRGVARIMLKRQQAKITKDLVQEMVSPPYWGGAVSLQENCLSVKMTQFGARSQAYNISLDDIAVTYCDRCYLSTVCLCVCLSVCLSVVYLGCIVVVT